MISAATARATLRDLLRSRESAKSNDVKLLQGAVNTMDALAQEGFSAISAIAKLALTSLEHPDGHFHHENIAQALCAIWGTANNIKDCVGFQAEEVDCGHLDESIGRRYAAHRKASEMRQVAEVSHV